ncbi:sulfite oxidase heme-binding subunit YedZ [Pseudohoeflea coraliihabitans]|uniref:Ferric reductase-like transmembrane domain-containing protein n=1 Tax=Pseudohoeflea coraliihabitans TaxID=2860393 RepID=A0ABS6WPS8_9HYPH|nr:ferric reductase-like transmembrane domain-containing protein [Pseudohoeflea sp. DP4N28-3]MBW3097958.1 ferric reductase-like transmembrane domain-containing protein [Pseudohoeflea sp. DP4N28-3]
MSILKSIWDHPVTFWVLLSLPAIPMILGLTSGDPEAIADVLHPTGEFAARFMILAMMITPLMLLFRNASWPRWLMKRRRYLGVAAFFYALAHTLLYLLDEGAVAFTGGEVTRLYIWTGWVAFLIFVPRAITSTDQWVRRLGRSWKRLQQWVYGAAVLTLVHWAALHDWGGVAPAVVHFAPLALLEIYRVWSRQQRRHQRAAA